LRERKHREEKPLALMFPSLESIKAECEVSPLEERLLRSPEAPIVLLRRIHLITPTDEKSQRMQNKKNKSVGTFHPLADSVAPNNPFLGIMLPYTPLHHLLMAELGFPVVATSGNLSDEPICIDEHEALERLGGIADVFLVHNRPIVRHVDDSIVRVMLDRELVLRRARGYAPLPIPISNFGGASSTSPKNQQKKDQGVAELRLPTVILAVGAHLKNTVALAVGNQIFISQHIGDLETEQAHSAFRRVIADFEKLYEAVPQIIAADLHPDYLSTKFALERRPPARHESKNASDQRAVPEAGAPIVMQVQHHIAHVLSCMAENEIAPPALGVSWDGTGYGLDGTVWGGEFFLVTDESVERVAHFRPFRLPGGDKAVKEPRRTALGLLHELSGCQDKSMLHMQHEFGRAFSPRELATLQSMLARKLNSPFCCSVGRLFDAVAALIGLRQQIRFEGQAAMELEFALDGIETDEAYELPMANSQSPIKNAGRRSKKPSRITSTLRSIATEDGHHASRILDWSLMVEEILSDVSKGVAPGVISAKFHNALAEAIITVAKRAGQSRVVLSGGCFQNRYLTERTVTRLRREGFQPYWHQRVPPNDGGIALGQVVAAWRRKE
jgi:hydrogenase maturation protein HypF